MKHKRLTPTHYAAMTATRPGPAEARAWAAEALDAIRRVTGVIPPLWTVLAVARTMGPGNRVDGSLWRTMERWKRPPAVTLTGALVHSGLLYAGGPREAERRPVPAQGVKR